MTPAPDPDPAAAPTRTVLLTVQYDGTDFHGWQLQPELRTVQGALGAAVEAMFHHAPILYGSSRTDAGVHARALPVAFDTTRDIPAHGILRGLNTMLPPDLAVIDAAHAPLGFRPREAAVAKTYTYRYQLGDARRPLTSRFSWHVKRRRFDLDGMREAATHLLGEHDFSSFRAAECDAHTTLRRLYALDVAAPDDSELVVLTVTGNAFLRNMVRIIAGTLAEVGFGRRPPEWVGAALAARDRRLAGQTAPASGLTLTTVHYEGYPRLGKGNAERDAHRAKDEGC
ncbi:MAG: tRNA pseudouridine(38-40) synthase TruA [Deltaproteobacteria bacterium]|nr:MAG: tRNA pseudouridine(38-40) synthase TruA [Deltaproteobacteria bacterium]